MYFGFVVMGDKIWCVGGRMELYINDFEELRFDRIEEYDFKEDIWSIMGRFLRKLDSRFFIIWGVYV